MPEHFSPVIRSPNPMAECIDAALAAATLQLAQTSETPRLDAELLMAEALGLTRGEMLLKRNEHAVPAAFVAMLSRRAQGEPVAYILGHQAFWDIDLKVTPDVLIPRGDSETLIEAAQSHFADKAPPGRALDLGTGSGALLLAALSLFPAANGIGVDASLAALAIARENAAALGFAGRADFRHLDWRAADWTNGLGAFDLILCNPPYVEADALLHRSVRDFEPHGALFSGAQGLDDYRIVIPHIPAILGDEGIAIFELGRGQVSAVSEIAKASGMDATARDDLAGIPRALILHKATR
jgi:release factor glutamine methyltransferase